MVILLMLALVLLMLELKARLELDGMMLDICSVKCVFNSFLLCGYVDVKRKKTLADDFSGFCVHLGIECFGI